MEACVIRTGVANTASIAAALARCGVEPVLTDDRARVEDAALVVLPGVGTFAVGMRAILESGLRDMLVERINAGRATLAVCLGMQLLARESEEAPGVSGLGILDARVERFPESARTPQFGWNAVMPEGVGAPMEPGHAYFANSYRLTSAPPGWGAAFTDHAGRFVSAIWRKRVLACQFHPELSGAWGARLIRSWAGAPKEAIPC